MATPLTKAIHRTVEIDGEEFIASLEPSKEFTLRKKRHKAVARQSMAELVGAEESPAPIKPVSTRVPRSNSSDYSWSIGEIQAKLAISPMDLKLKSEVMKAVEDLLTVDEALQDDSCTLNP